MSLWHRTRETEFLLQKLLIPHVGTMGVSLRWDGAAPISDHPHHKHFLNRIRISLIFFISHSIHSITVSQSSVLKNLNFDFTAINQGSTYCCGVSH